MDAGLSEKGKKEALALIDAFKVQLAEVATKTISKCYTDLLPEHIEGDAWTNYREQIRDEMRNYFPREVIGTVENNWARQVREIIYREYKADLVGLLNQDSLQEIEDLKRKLSEAYRVF